MKSLQELYMEITENDKLKNEFLAAVNQGEQQTLDFVNSNGCDVTLEEMKAFADEFEADSEGELSEEELQNVAGGLGKGEVVALSICTIGIGCGTSKIKSHVEDSNKPDNPSLDEIKKQYTDDYKKNYKGYC